MATVVAEEELYRSCHVLFGRDLKVTREFLQYLQLPGLKKAYRKKALEIHPDRIFGKNMAMQQSMAHQFIDVHQAYQNLVGYLAARDNGTSLYSSPFPGAKEPGRAARRQESTGPGNRGFCQERAYGFQSGNGGGKQSGKTMHEPLLDPKSLYKGPIPNCSLLFGRYLYYSGVISMHTIGQALLWQRSQRPRFGEIARRLGWLNDRDTLRILQSRRDRHLFGELAMRLGILSREQLQYILLHQQRHHKRIGQYFVAEKFWDAFMLEEYIAAQRKHNSRVQNLRA